jgi:shikimate dehydrogenase
MNKQYGLIGYPLSHSFSSSYFSSKFSSEKITNCTYENFPIKSIDKLPKLIAENFLLHGLNVTIPYKEAVIPYLDNISESAKEIGAVNTIKIIRNHSTTLLEGHNTDVFGFERTLLINNVKLPQNTLIMGTGGASKAVEWVLRKHNCNVLFGSRNPDINKSISYKDIDEKILKNYTLIINTTPIGMYPKIDQVPDIPYEIISANHTCIDLIYNPEETLFLSKAKAQRAKSINGLYMLEQQAEKAWEIWNREK